MVPSLAHDRAFTPPEPAQFAAMLDADPTISHIFIVHCETSTGILNPLDALGREDRDPCSRAFHRCALLPFRAGPSSLPHALARQTGPGLASVPGVCVARPGEKRGSATDRTPLRKEKSVYIGIGTILLIILIVLLLVYVF